MGGDQVLGPDPRFDGPNAGPLVISAGDACVDALAPFIGRDWRSVRARDLEWSVWDTMVHVNDDLYFYAAQVLLADEHDYICFELAADAHANPQRLLAAFAVHARLLAGPVASADPTSRANHVYGVSDPGGFAAMGVVEALVHTYDAVHGLDSSSTWRPPDDLAAAVLDRLFPHTPPDTVGSPAELLLHMAGRISLGDAPRRCDWRWYGAASQSTPSGRPVCND